MSDCGVSIKLIFVFNVLDVHSVHHRRAYTQKEREINRHTHTDTQTQTQTHTLAPPPHTHTHRNSHRETDADASTHTDTRTHPIVAVNRYWTQQIVSMPKKSTYKRIRVSGVDGDCDGHVDYGGVDDDDCVRTHIHLVDYFSIQSDKK